MKKYLCFMFVIFLIPLLIFSGNRSFENSVVGANIKHNVLDNNIIEIESGDVEEFLEKLDVVVLSKFEVADRVIIEGYTSKISRYVLINNCKVNVQISIANDIAIVGSPLINASF